jgi:hypothetical protein
MKSGNLIAGCGESKIMTMCLIYLLAGAFAVVSKGWAVLMPLLI